MCLEGLSSVISSYTPCKEKPQLKIIGNWNYAYSPLTEFLNNLFRKNPCSNCIFLIKIINCLGSGVTRYISLFNNSCDVNTIKYHQVQNFRHYCKNLFSHRTFPQLFYGRNPQATYPQWKLSVFHIFRRICIQTFNY